MKQPLTYFLEKLTNVQCFQLYVNTPSNLQADTPPPKIQVIMNSIHCVWGEYEVHIALDCEVDGSQSDYQIMTDCLEIKIPFHKEKGYIDDSFQKLITTKDIENLCCRSCGTTILQKNVLGSRNHINKFPLEEIRAREGVCFVGDTYFLLHSSNLCEDSIELSGMSAKEAYGKVSGCKTNSEWMPVSCTECHEGLGLIENTADAVQETKKGTKLYNYKLFKHRLSTAIGANEAYNALKIFSAETLCAANILSTSQIHTIFKYHVRSTDGRVFLQISLLNWDTTMQTNMIPSNDVKLTIMTPILKVLYRVCDPLTEEAKKNVDLWNTKFSPRTLTFFDGECKELVEGLQKTTKLIPESKRNFREFSVGFLQFISND